MKVFEVKFGCVGGDSYLRNDAKYHFFSSAYNWNLFQVKTSQLIPLREILEESYTHFEYQEDIEYKGIPTGQQYINIDGEIQGYQGVFLEDRPDRLKYKVNKYNILISSLRLAKSPALNFYEQDDLDSYVFSNGFYIFNVKEGWNKRFVLFLLRNKNLKRILDNYIYRGIGISAYKVEDLLRIKIPAITKPAQDKIVSKIEPIENKIKELKTIIKKPQEVINKVFAREFGFDLEKFERLKNVKNYYSDLSSFGNNKDIRNSVAFHQESAQFVMSQLKKITNSRIKQFLSEPIVLGSSISPSDFSDSGNYYYISMATVKNYILELDESQLVSNEYSKNNLNKSISKNDIIMTRSGVAIGKFALVEDGTHGIFADFTMRIRLSKYNPYFAYYYFRSEYFQHLIHSNKKGLQNKNIFPSQIQEFPIIDIPISDQQRIVNEIKKELDKQDDLKQQIELQRDKIDELITESLTKM